MTPMEELPTEFERQARQSLEEGVTRLDGRIRSRLNQARQAAVTEATRGRRNQWLRFSLMPAGAVAAALLVAFFLWPHAPKSESPLLTESGHATVEDLDLLADGDGLDLVSEDSAGAFYEWAVEQNNESNETSS